MFNNILCVGIFTVLVFGFAKIGISDETPSPESKELYDAAHAQQLKPGLVMVGTINEDGLPEIRVMSNLRNEAHAASKLFGENDFSTFAVTRADTEKLKQLAKNPNMAMYYQEGAQGLLLMGKGEVFTDAKTRQAAWDDGFKKLGYSGFDDPMFTVIRFTPVRGKFYYKGKQNHLTFSKSTGTAAEDRAEIEKTIALYIEGHRKGKSEIMKGAFHPSATVFLGQKSDPVKLLYDLTDSQDPATDITCKIGPINVSDTIGMAQVELDHCYGHRYTDMFTLVKTDQGWKITCKVSHRK